MWTEVIIINTQKQLWAQNAVDSFVTYGATSVNDQETR